MKKILEELNSIKRMFGLYTYQTDLRLSFEEVLKSPQIKLIFKQMYISGLLKKLLPEFLPCIGLDQKNVHHIYTVDQHILTAVNNVSNKTTLAKAKKDLLIWVLLLHDIGKPSALKLSQKRGKYNFTNHAKYSAKMTPKILKRFSFKRSEIKQIKLLVQYHEIFRYMRLYNMGKWGNRLTTENIFKIIEKTDAKNFELLLDTYEFDFTSQGEYWRDKKKTLHKRANDIFIYYKKLNNLPL